VTKHIQQHVQIHTRKPYGGIAKIADEIIGIAAKEKVV
jgi:hypothetical protein